MRDSSQQYPVRFHVESEARRFVIFDSVETRYLACSALTRVDAERECAALNSVRVISPGEQRVSRRKKRKHTKKPGQLLHVEPIEEENLLSRSAEVLASFRGISIAEAEEQLKIEADRGNKAADTYKTWLPQLLKAWAIAVRSRHAPKHASAWDAATVLAMLESNVLMRYSDTTGASRTWIDAITWHVCASPMTPEVYGDGHEAYLLSDVLAVHYLSDDKANIKAARFGMSRRAYFRKLDEAHRKVARTYPTRPH